MTTATTTELVPGSQVGALTVRLTREQLVRYAGASGDFNPIHYSDHFATALGLPGVIAHGMLTMGTALRVVTDWSGDPARVVSYSARFSRPVVVPDDAEGAEVTFTATVTSVDAGIAVLGIEAICDGVKVLAAARAEVTLPSAIA
ncbi:MAG TPA: MaoC/PaaZ C-terminal domain-containing protein [Propionibacteriaceae bacterium]|nr:MaoC/PaaZ C-terminal domain-containing protein [Propionibacteriaceae bacterium]